MSTGIEWTDETWNPLRAAGAGGYYTDAYGQPDGEPKPALIGWHCEHVSEGCRNCYAESINRDRFGTGLPYTRPSREQVEVYLDEAVLLRPLRWKKPRRVFVCSMTDLFGEWVTDEMLDRVFAVMALGPQHTFQVLTKRPERMREYLVEHAAGGRHVWPAAQAIALPGGRHKPETSWPLPNVWLGVSTEDQATADARIPVLVETPAAVRFVSAEPLIGPIDFKAVPGFNRIGLSLHNWWIVVGGESGRGARPCNVEWVRGIVRQCRAAGVPVFVRQLGAKPGVSSRDALGGWPGSPGVAADFGGYVLRLRDRKGGEPSEWSEDLRVRQFPGGAS